MNVEFHTERKEVAPAPSTLKTLGYRSPSPSEAVNTSPKEDFNSAIQGLVHLREQAVSGDLIRSREEATSFEDVALMPEALEEFNDGMSLGFDLSSEVSSTDSAVRTGSRIRSTHAVGPMQEAAPTFSPAGDSADVDEFADDGMALLADPGGPNFPSDRSDDSRNFDGGDQWKDDDRDALNPVEERVRQQAPEGPVGATPAAPIAPAPVASPAAAAAPAQPAAVAPAPAAVPAPAPAQKMPGYPAGQAPARVAAKGAPNPWHKVARPSQAQEVREIFESENPFNLNGVDDATWPKVQQGLQKPAPTPQPQVAPAETPLPAPAPAQPSVTVSTTSHEIPASSVPEPRKPAPTVFFSLSKHAPAAVPVAETAPAPAQATPAPPASEWPSPALPVSEPSPAPAPAPEPAAPSMVTAEEAAQALNALNTGGRPSMGTGLGDEFNENAPKGFTDIGPKDTSLPSTVPSVEFPKSFVEPTPAAEPASQPAAPSSWPSEASVKAPVESAWPAPSAPTPEPPVLAPEPPARTAEPPALASEVPWSPPAAEQLPVVETQAPELPNPEPEASQELWTPKVDAFTAPVASETTPIAPASFSTAIEHEEGWSRKVSDDSPEPTVESVEVETLTKDESLAHPADSIAESSQPTALTEGADIPSAREFAEEIISITCPACQEPLKLQRENLGVSGSCISCNHPLVAFETFAGSVSAVKLDPSQVPPTDPSKAPTFFIATEPAAAPSEPISETAPTSCSPAPVTPKADTPDETLIESSLEVRNPWSNPAPPTSIPSVPPTQTPESTVEAEAPAAFDDLRADQAEPVLGWLKNPQEDPVVRPTEGSEAHAEAAKAAFTSLFQAPEKSEPMPEPPSLQPSSESSDSVDELPEPSSETLKDPVSSLSETTSGGFSAAIMDLPKKTTGVRKQLDLPTQKSAPFVPAEEGPSDTQNLPISDTEEAETNSFGGKMPASSLHSQDSNLQERQDASSLTGESIFGSLLQTPESETDSDPSAQSGESRRSGGAAVVLTLFVLAVFGTALAMFFIPGMGDQVGKLKSKVLELVPALSTDVESSIEPMVPAEISPYAPTPEPTSNEGEPAVDEVEEFDLGIFDGPVERKEEPSVAAFRSDLPVPSGVIDTLHSGMTPVPRRQPALDQP